MARIRSPGYPSFTLEQAIEFARKIHAEDRQHPVDRATAARHMGFSGPSGASDRGLSALMHFELVEKVHKGEIRVTDLALSIIHPNTAAERREALHKAGFAPDLFKELRERYPDAPPSRDSLSSYLSRSGFASAAIPSATRSYVETCFFLQRENAYESGGTAESEASESSAVDEQLEDSKVQTAQREVDNTGVGGNVNAGAQRLTRMSTRVLEPNEIYMDFRGSREVHIEGILDLNGVLELEQKLPALKMLLKAPVAAANDSDQ